MYWGSCESKSIYFFNLTILLSMCFAIDKGRQKAEEDLFEEFRTATPPTWDPIDTFKGKPPSREKIFDFFEFVNS
jgi:hypothetical protein